MKNISLYLNIVLFVAVTLLYVDRFGNAGDDHNSGENVASLEQDSSVLNAEIVFVNVDSLLSGYDYYNDLKTQLLKQQQQLEANLNSKSKAFERKTLEFQQKVEKHLVTQRQGQEMQQQLYVEQQNLLQLRDQLQMQLMEQEQSMNKMMYNEIHAYLAEYNKTANHKYIISNATGGSTLLFGEPELNITNIIMAGLNTRYQNKQAETETEATND